MRYAEVAVDAPLAYHRTFTYSIPPSLPVQPGHAVRVPFGSRRLQGVVVGLSDEPAVEETRDILALAHPEPLLTPIQIELALWISNYYLSPLYPVLAAMLPPGFGQRELTFVEAVQEPSPVALASLTPEQRAAWEWLRRQGSAEMAEAEKAFGKEKARRLLDPLLRKGLLTRRRELQRRRLGPKVAPYLRLALSPDEALNLAGAFAAKARTAPQAALLRCLLDASEPLLVTEAVRRAGCGPSTVEALSRKGAIVVERRRVLRDPLEGRSYADEPALELTPEQAAAWRELAPRLSGAASEPSVFLLHGVTGSGKTELYLRALAEVAARGKRGLVLVPEIALTPQTIQRFAARFPDKVAVLHSRLSPGEAFDEWWRIREGDFQVVIGSRGSIFAPQPDLGLIVIDEEHEWTYKQQEQAPLYHAREVALKLAELSGSVVIMGSATPDIVTYHRACQGRYRLLELRERVAAGDGTGLPEVEVVDMRRELREGVRGIFSRSLRQRMASALAAREQVILFLNRRGSAAVVQCRACGHVLRCSRCEVALTYHADEDALVCHQCNRRSRMSPVCPECFSPRLSFLGLGTQRLEEEVRHAFPRARILRWDRDVTGAKGSHEEALRSFLAHEADILVGTQMIAKGLHLPLVTLVGVVNADIALHLPDYRSGERTFQLLTQVAGRAGRGERGGHVVIQTYSPEHYAVAAAALQDYDGFYRQEVAFRHQMANPPFSRLARLLFLHTNASAAQAEAERLFARLKAEVDAWGMPEVSLIGPAPAYLARVRGRYRWQIVVRAPDPTELLRRVTPPRGWQVDVDPASLL